MGYLDKTQHLRPFELSLSVRNSGNRNGYLLLPTDSSAYGKVYATTRRVLCESNSWTEIKFFVKLDKLLTQTLKVKMIPEHLENKPSSSRLVASWKICIQKPESSMYIDKQRKKKI